MEVYGDHRWDLRLAVPCLDVPYDNNGGGEPVNTDTHQPNSSNTARGDSGEQHVEIQNNDGGDRIRNISKRTEGFNVRSPNDLPTPESMGIILGGPRYSQFAILSKRQETFSSWPPIEGIDTESMAEAGFAYIGKTKKSIPWDFRALCFRIPVTAPAETQRRIYFISISISHIQCIIIEKHILKECFIFTINT